MTGDVYDIAPIDLEAILAQRQRGVEIPGLGQVAAEALAVTYLQPIVDRCNDQAALTQHDLEILVMISYFRYDIFKETAEQRLTSLVHSQHREVRALYAIHKKVGDLTRRVTALERAASANRGQAH